MPGQMLQDGFEAMLDLFGETLVYTPDGFAAVTLKALIERLGPNDEHYNGRVGTRFAVEVLAGNLVTEAGAAITPVRRDQVAADFFGSGKVVEISRDWGGIWRLIIEVSQRLEVR